MQSGIELSNGESVKPTAAIFGIGPVGSVIVSELQKRGLF